MRMQIGTVDAVSTDDNILYGLKAQDPTTKLIGDRFTDEPHGIAMRPTETDFVRFVNGVLDQMRADGSWMDLYRKYLAPEAGSDSATAPPVAEYRTSFRAVSRGGVEVPSRAVRPGRGARRWL